MKCNKCNSEILEDSKFCNICGNTITKENNKGISLKKSIESENIATEVTPTVSATEQTTQTVDTAELVTPEPVVSDPPQVQHRETSGSSGNGFMSAILGMIVSAIAVFFVNMGIDNKNEQNWKNNVNDMNQIVLNAEKSFWADYENSGIEIWEDYVGYTSFEYPDIFEQMDEYLAQELYDSELYFDEHNSVLLTYGTDNLMLINIAYLGYDEYGTFIDEEYMYMQENTVVDEKLDLATENNMKQEYIVEELKKENIGEFNSIIQRSKNMFSVYKNDSDPMKSGYQNVSNTNVITCYIDVYGEIYIIKFEHVYALGNLDDELKLKSEKIVTDIVESATSIPYDGVDYENTEVAEEVVATKKTELELAILYEDILKDYEKIINYGYESYSYESYSYGDYSNTYVSGLLRYYDFKYDSLYYDFVDIDGDGIEELFINGSKDLGDKGSFLACHTLWGGDLSTLFITDERFGARLGADLYFYEYGSGGADSYEESEVKFQNKQVLDYNESIGFKYNNIASYDWYNFDYKHISKIYEQESDRTTDSNIDAINAYDGVNVIDLNVNDKIGNFTITSLTVKNEMPYYELDCYDFFGIELEGIYNANITSVGYDYFQDKYIIQLDRSPLKIQTYKPHSNKFESFRKFDLTREELENIVSEDVLNEAKKFEDNEIIRVSIPIEILEMSTWYQAYSGGFSNHAVIRLVN